MQIICGKIDGIEWDVSEICQRLQIPRGIEIDGVDRCMERLMTVMDCRYAYVKVPVDVSADGVCCFDFSEVRSRDLGKALCGCREAYLLGVTLGVGVDRLLCRLNLLSQAEHFITDALASAAAEALCDQVNALLRQDSETLRPRFSPGYGDLPLSFQEPLLGRLQGIHTLGIVLNGAYLMTPVKSITAIVGVI